MVKFIEIKSEYPTALLFYRMGDFYELFFDDAVAAAAALDISLTKRGKHLGQDIPMCGVPHHAAENYLLTLIRKGFRVAVCEQLESPKEAKMRGTKSVVKRGVVRLVTPGTLTEDSLLVPRQSNYLAAFAEIRGEGCLAWVDISTGDLRYCPCPSVRLSPELARLAPAEILISKNSGTDVYDVISDAGIAFTELHQEAFDSIRGRAQVSKAYGNLTLDGLGDLDRSSIAVLGALVEYLDATQKGQLPLLRKPVCESGNDFVAIDAATRKNLELTETLAGEKKGSLLSVVDRTITGAGARLLYRRITAPSQNLGIIESRASAVQFFCENSGLRLSVRSTLKQMPDIERALSRLALGRGGPRDLGTLSNGLIHATKVEDLLKTQILPSLLSRVTVDLLGHEDLCSELGDALVAEPPLLARDGEFVAANYSATLDEIKSLRDKARSVIARMQAEYASASSISTLKIKHNNVLGYFIETTGSSCPAHACGSFICDIHSPPNYSQRSTLYYHRFRGTRNQDLKRRRKSN